MTSNVGTAEKLLNGKNASKKDKVILRTCVEVYNTAIAEISEAVSFISLHDQANTITKLSAALTNVHTCIDYWEESKQKPLMSKENDDAKILSHLVLEIAGLL